VQKVVAGAAAAAAADAAAAAAAAPADSLGAALSSLDAPAAVSTLAKSGMDWDTYKAAHGLDDELANAAKEGVGYLGKQTFLARVGERTDELALDAARRAAASAALAAAAAGGGRG
jgi:hypothetical protein